MDAIIVDDEILVRNRISKLLTNNKEITIIKECSNGRIAISEINRLKPSLIFLDVNLQDLNGFQVLQNINFLPKPIIIFISKHPQHALKAFDFGAFDFLLKPIDENRLLNTVEKIRRNKFFLNSKEINETSQNKPLPLDKKDKGNGLIPIRKGNKTILLESALIKYIIASGSYAEIYTAEKKYIVRDSLNKLIQVLDNTTFFRIHRSSIINLKHIQEIVHSNYSEIDVRMKDEKLIRVSKSQKQEFLNQLGL